MLGSVRWPLQFMFRWLVKRCNKYGDSVSEISSGSSCSSVASSCSTIVCSIVSLASAIGCPTVSYGLLWFAPLVLHQVPPSFHLVPLSFHPAPPSLDPLFLHNPRVFGLLLLLVTLVLIHLHSSHPCVAQRLPGMQA